MTGHAYDRPKYVGNTIRRHQVITHYRRHLEDINFHVLGDENLAVPNRTNAVTDWVCETKGTWRQAETGL